MRAAPGGAARAACPLRRADRGDVRAAACAPSSRSAPAACSPSSSIGSSGRAHRAIHLDRKGKHGVTSLQDALGRLRSRVSRSKFSRPLGRATAPPVEAPEEEAGDDDSGLRREPRQALSAAGRREGAAAAEPAASRRRPPAPPVPLAARRAVGEAAGAAGPHAATERRPRRPGARSTGSGCAPTRRRSARPPRRTRPISERWPTATWPSCGPRRPRSPD